MNINRHNYEEFFTLYMDNELSSDDRRMVEAFVKNHPDLNEELEMMMHYKMVPDASIIFNGKETLLKGDSLINLANYEEWFLLYADNELTTDQKQLVDEFVINNPSAQKEFELLQKTKLHPEKIVFNNKEVLYRKENVRRLPVYWWRAAAAVLIIALGLTTFLVLNNKPSTESAPIVKTPAAKQLNPETTTTIQPDKESIVAEVIEKQDPVSITTPEEKDKIQQAIAPVKIENKNNIAIKNAVVKPELNTPIKNNKLQSKKEEPVFVTNNNKQGNNLPQPINNPNVKNDATNNAIANNNIPNKPKQTESLTNPVVTTTTTQPSDYTNASFIEEESQQDDKKNKLRGFFRKLTRTFEKRTNIDATDDDNKLLVAGLSIKLK